MKDAIFDFKNVVDREKWNSMSENFRGFFKSRDEKIDETGIFQYDKEEVKSFIVSNKKN